MMKTPKHPPKVRHVNHERTAEEFIEYLHQRLRWQQAHPLTEKPVFGYDITLLANVQEWRQHRYALSNEEAAR